jgi:hypothetical protein
MPDTPPAKALLHTFGRIVVINLPERADRRREIDAELRRAGLSLDHPAVELFAAIRPDAADGFPSRGAHGAFRSHLGVMERMLACGWDRALILEDDMEFAPGFADRLPRLAQALQARDWGMVYGHPGDMPERTPAPDADGLIILPADLGLIQLHFFGITRDFAATAVPILRQMMARPEGSPDGGPMHVDGAINWVRRANPGLVALAIAPEIAQQRASRSDIADPRWYHRVPGLRRLVAWSRRMRQG